MIGRAAIGNPWIFDEIKTFASTGKIPTPPTVEERIRTVKKHLTFSIEWKGLNKGIYEMRRHYSNYFRNMPNFKPYRTKLVQSEHYEEIMDIFEEISQNFTNVPLTS